MAVIPSPRVTLLSFPQLAKEFVPKVTPSALFVSGIVTSCNSSHPLKESFPIFCNFSENTAF